MKMKRMGWITLMVAMCVGMEATAQQHNILLIIGDDIGLDSLDISNTSTNASYPPIPAIQNLAENGILFSNGYAYPTCSPTRSSILTGRYGYRTGVLSPQSSENFSADENTLPEIFADQALGYELASFGKWHLGDGDTGPNVTGGWPHFSGSLGGSLGSATQPRKYYNWTKVVDGVSTNLTDQYATSINVTDAATWIAGQGTNNWFAWIGFNAAHTPLHKPPDGLHSYSLLGAPTSSARPHFEAMIEAMDSEIGRLLTSVDTNDTTIIFLGDNGTANGVIQPPYDITGRAKGSLYEGGTHVPFLICGADVVSGGRTNDSVVHCADLFATIIELAGGTVPTDAGEDSRSLVPIIENTSFTPSEDCILVESDSLSGAADAGRAIRDAQYKLIRVDDVDSGFYDMLVDPLESTNLLSGSMSGGEQAAYDALSAKLDSWTNTPVVVEIPTNGYPIVDTGQLNCYDDVGGYTVAAPAPGAVFAGQDGQYAGNQPSYQDNGDGTVTDLNTGLMWQQTPDLVNKSSWTNAVTNAVNQTTAGYADWRLPTLKELYSLIDFTGDTGSSEADAVPYINTNYFDFAYGDTNTERYIDAQYWTMTEYVGLTMAGDETVFGVNFADGRIKGYPRFKKPSGDNLSFVRYVRGNTEYGINSFVGNGNGTVTDHATGLMWQQGDSVVTQNWEQALAYAEGLELAGYRDWRLPNAKELQSIVDYTRAPLVTGTAAIDTNYFDVTETESFYWTSTTHLDGAPLTRGNYAVYLCFGQAYGWMPVPPGQTDTYALYDVHGAGAQRSDPKSGTPVLEAPGHGPQGDVLRIYNYVRCVRAGANEPSTDTDGDGLTDWYEYNYSSSITNMDATADDDDDGFINGDENKAGTIPTLGSSLLQMTDLEPASTGMVVRWSSELDRSYTLAASTNLVTDAFSAVIGGSIAATPPVNEYIDGTPLGSNRFYRVEVEE
jgi:arylsulfatase A-like enzyme